MDTLPNPDSGNVAELPPYLALLGVDVKDFSGNPGRHHAELTEAIPGILRQTFNRCGLAELWEEMRFQFTTGDGYVLGFRSVLLPFLLNPFLPTLQEELDYRNEVSSVSGQGRIIRMRVSINVGPVTDSGENRISDGSGDTRIEVHRLLDSPPVRDLLTRSTDTTCVAAIVSSRAFEDAVVAGFTDEDPNLYVEAPVEVKSYQGTAYMRVPKPSGDLLTYGFRPAEPGEQNIATGQQEPTQAGHRNTMSDVHVQGPVIQARDHTERRRGGIGNVGSIGTAITDARGPVNVGPGNQFNTPQFTGDGVNYVAGDNSGNIHQQFGTPRAKRRRKDDDGD